MEAIYLDNAATTAVDGRVIEAMGRVMAGEIANPSSVHGPGVRARRLLEDARARVAGVIGASPEEVVLTSSGTEADSLALLGPSAMPSGCRVIVSSVEHAAVMEAAKVLAQRGVEVIQAPVDRQGLVDASSLLQAVTPQTRLVSIMLANNEVGAIQPVASLAQAIKAKNRACLVHSDAVAALGKIHVNVTLLGVDLLSLSAHKIHGPQGVGALYVRRGVEISPLIPGGGQERGRRGGTENLPGAVGLAVAMELAQAGLERAPAIALLRDMLEAHALELLPEAKLNGPRESRTPDIASITVPGVASEPLLHALEAEGVIASNGAACSSHSARVSHVLRAMGRQERDGGTLRFSLSRHTRPEEVVAAAEALFRAVERLRKPRRQRCAR